MNARLRSMLAAGFVFLIGGVAYQEYTRQPAGRAIADLRDAGLFSEREDRWVKACTEEIAPSTVRKLQRNGYGTFRAGTVHRIARVVVQHGLPDGGAEIVNTSRDTEENDADGGDEEDETDTSLSFTVNGCTRLECNDLSDAGIRELVFLPDGGARHAFDDGGARPYCNVSTRVGRIVPLCVIPDCWTRPDGGWNDTAVVDCQGSGRDGYVWRGCNVFDARLMNPASTKCIPVECGVRAGVDAVDVLR